MKILFACSLLMCSLASHAQSIKVAETDSITHIRRVGTTPCLINKNSETGFALALRSEDTAVFIKLSLFQPADRYIAAGSALVLRLENDRVVVARSKGLQVRSADYNAPLEYRISLRSIKKLYRSAIRSAGYYTAGGEYIALDVNDADSTGLQQVCVAFLAEYQKPSVDASNLAGLSRTRR